MEDHTISDAIHKHRRLRFWYRGGVRTVEPYAFGVADGGHPVLRAYQVSGFSRSLEQGWKLFHLEEMRDTTVLEETFDHPRQGYMRNDPAMVKIYCEL
ncbi:WYL domain-containing protein [Nitrospirillum viridazoti]|uniref:WYL domain-containing protein n=1 Tax=Nitrospirillum amazonense TaxID=28077 RepID=A0A560HMD4_9PROT|nr:WYL domain-containing protein [Nitrospirillum amazonense]TWB47693.1 WYL domain-containing protein [Nitrospirillum amazonense]